MESLVKPWLFSLVFDVSCFKLGRVIFCPMSV
jgi:hypothetical protein